MRVNDIYSTQMRANDIGICTFLIIFDSLSRNNQEWLRMNRNEWEILFMTVRNVLISSRLPFMNSH